MLKSKDIFEELKRMYPVVQCELDYKDIYQLLIAVVLSAQTTDKLVNVVTKTLFTNYPNFLSLSKAEVSDVKEIIKTIGLANTKAKNIISLSQKVIVDGENAHLNSFDYLTSLPGVGRKTANVVLSEGFKIPRIAVDTHVFRVSNRLNLASANDVLSVEKQLMEKFPENIWYDLHLRLVFFGRYFCKAQKPRCQECPFIIGCQYQTKNTL